MFSANTIPLVLGTAAIASLGIPWVGIDPARDRDTVRAQFTAVAPTIVLLDTALPDAAMVAELAHARRAMVVDLRQIGAVAERSWPAAEWTAPLFVALGFTSGTTGTPKLFERRRRTENQRLVYLRDQFSYGLDDVYLVTSPLAHASGHVWASAALALGATVVLGDPEPDRIVTAIERWRVTATFMVPPTADAFLASAFTRPDADLSSLRALFTGGRHVSTRTVRNSRQRLGDVLYVYYATTETGINTFADPVDLARDPLTAGRPLPGVHLRVLDPVDRVDQPVGEVGQIAISSRLNMDGYVGATAELLHRDDRTYVLTSDYGRLDDEGRLFILGRGDVVSRAGLLDIVRLESELKELAEVDDVCVTRQERDGAVEVVAAVIPAANSTTAIDVVRGRLADLLNADCSVIDVSDIPYNTAGKVDVRALAARIDASRLQVA